MQIDVIRSLLVSFCSISPHARVISYDGSLLLERLSSTPRNSLRIRPSLVGRSRGLEIATARQETAASAGYPRNQNSTVPAVQLVHVFLNCLVRAAILPQGFSPRVHLAVSALAFPLRQEILSTSRLHGTKTARTTIRHLVGHLGLVKSQSFSVTNDVSPSPGSHSDGGK